MIFHELPLAGAYEIELEFIEDERGNFARTFCVDEFGNNGLETNYVQNSVSINQSAGTVRGLHFQKEPYAEVKLVSCTAGEAFDVIVDIRPRSKTFGNWYGVIISDQKKNTIYVPKEFAHGVQSLKDNTVISYQISVLHNPDASLGINCSDPSLNIEWPLDIAVISDKDRSLPDLKSMS